MKVNQEVKKVAGDTEKVNAKQVGIPIPSKVRNSRVEELPEPVAKEGGEEKKVEEIPSEAIEEAVDEVLNEGNLVPKGTILIEVYKDAPYKVVFDGFITGSEIDLAWRRMMKQYHLWKSELSKDKKKTNGGVS